MKRLNFQSSMTRRSMMQAAAAAALSIPAIAKSATTYAKDKLAGRGEVVVFSYGGSYTKGVRKYVYEPFTEATGINVVDVTGDFAEPQVRAMNQAGRIDWDLALIDPQNFPAMQAAGMFLPIDYSLWDEESLKGTPQSARLEQAVVAFRSSGLLAYDKRAFPKGGPKSWADFWDVKAFPGPRGLSANNPRHIVFALLADGVPKTDLYPLTDEKIDRALKKLNEIKPHVSKWWTAGGEPVQALINGEFVMSTCYDGRAISGIRQGAPIQMVWDSGILIPVYNTVLKGGPNNANAQKLIAFMNRAKIAAGFTLGTNLPGANVNQLQHLPANLVPLLNITKENASKLVVQDNDWLAAKRPNGKTNMEHLQERWMAWRTR